MMTVATSSHGKRGYLRMGFELDSQGRSILRDLYRRVPIIVQQALYFDSQMPLLPCVYILSAGGHVVEGDDFQQHFVLRKGSCAHISTGAATKVAQMRGGRASMRQRIILGEESYLEYLPEVVIPCRGAVYEVDNEIVVDESATLFYSEIFTSGRRYSGERFCYRKLALNSRVVRPNGEAVYVDCMEVEPESGDIFRTGVMAGYEIFASILILTPKHVLQALQQELQPYMRDDMALGVHRLPFDAGISCRILGQQSASVKDEVRRICSALRLKVKGCTLPPEFVWK